MPSQNISLVWEYHFSTYPHSQLGFYTLFYCKVNSDPFCYVCKQFIYMKKDRYRNTFKQHICYIMDSQWIIKIKNGSHMFFVKAVSLLLYAGIRIKIWIFSLYDWKIFQIVKMSVISVLKKTANFNWKEKKNKIQYSGIPLVSKLITHSKTFPNPVCPGMSNMDRQDCEDQFMQDEYDSKFRIRSW